MTQSVHRLITALAAAAAFGAAGGAAAQQAGQWTAKVGVNQITPHVESGDVSAPALPGTKADVGSDIEPVFVFAYGITDHISAELDIGLPYSHSIYGAGAIAGTGRLATVEALPPTAFIQYRFFEPTATWRPYLGVGVTYARFQRARGSGALTALTNTGGPATSFKIDNKVAGTLQAGIVYNMNARWFADLNVTKTFLKTRVNYSTGQTQDMTLDPQSVSVGIGYKF
ncbi:MAG: OmpW family outer membrane protein [Massilia sp.]